MILIALDLMLEWLWHSRQKMMGAEYWVALATFLAIGLTNIELGYVRIERGRGWCLSEVSQMPAVTD